MRERAVLQQYDREEYYLLVVVVKDRYDRSRFIENIFRHLPGTKMHPLEPVGREAKSCNHLQIVADTIRPFLGSNCDGPRFVLDLDERPKTIIDMMNKR